MLYQGCGCFDVARVPRDNYLCDFVIRDIKIAGYLESPRKINFNLASDILVSEISEKTGFNYS